ncbi:unnamed protein product [Xylocopa violacea]|uniref:Orcokinin n=1 Tax=Xylocopa violacea TaxID=135666 RepID=A0ABP1NNY8_XYLVO
MANHAASALSILLLSIATAAWVTAVPTVQAGTDALRRNLYGSANPEFLDALFDDHESMRHKIPQVEQQSSRLGNSGGTAAAGSGKLGRGPVGSDENASDRLSRNLDHIGGGNLLRRELAERQSSHNARRWFPSQRNLDQIGGGNLLREVNDRGERNLDQIGGGNLVRSLDGVIVAAEDLRRNLDKIGGGNLVHALEPRNLDDDRATRLRSSAWPKQGRRGIDFSSGLTTYLIDDADVPSAVRSAGLLPSDRMLLERFAKRNIDEIDRTSFDNFFKRSDDEMDRVEWNGFVKRLADYLAAARTNALERRG